MKASCHKASWGKKILAIKKLQHIYQSEYSGIANHYS